MSPKYTLRPSSFSWVVLFSLYLHVYASTWIQYPPNGFATMTHYDMPRDYIASCGCTGASTHYPTAALSQMAYGSSNSYGPACGKCFKLTLLNTFLSDPPFYPPKPTSIVVKITDLCPLSEDGWCSGMVNKTNAAGHQLNFDLSFPSAAIPSDFFPSDQATYGYTDFGVWNITYETVSCKPNWAGAKDNSALGSLPSLADGGCCPANPQGTVNDTCPSFSDQNGIPPDTRSGFAIPRTIPHPGILIAFAWLCYQLI